MGGEGGGAYLQDVAVEGVGSHGVRALPKACGTMRAFAVKGRGVEAIRPIRAVLPPPGGQLAPHQLARGHSWREPLL